jgi:O-acetylhomoserine/O-acetylserine sulfhydrylase-like pyridoxal-dependent enzyme
MVRNIRSMIAISLFFLLSRQFHFLQRPPGLTFSSGLAAVCSIVQLLSCGDHIVAMDDLYGGTSNYLKQIAERMNIKTTFVDATDADNVENAIQENTRVRFTYQYVDS